MGRQRVLCSGEGTLNNSALVTTTNKNNNNTSMDALEEVPKRPGNEALSSTYVGNAKTSTFNTNIIIVTASLLLILLLILAVNFITRWLLNRLINHQSEAATAKKSSGLTKKHVSAIPTIRFSTAANVAGHVVTSSCPICLLDFGPGESIRLLPNCHHAFHISCIDTWLAKHASCPTCRDDLLRYLPPLLSSPRFKLQIVITPPTLRYPPTLPQSTNLVPTSPNPKLPTLPPSHLSSSSSSSSPTPLQESPSPSSPTTAPPTNVTSEPTSSSSSPTSPHIESSPQSSASSFMPTSTIVESCLPTCVESYTSSSSSPSSSTTSRL